MLTSLWNQFGIKKEEDSSDDDDDDVDTNEPLNTGDSRNRDSNNGQHPPPSSSSEPSDSNPGPFKTFHPPSFLRPNSMGNNNTNVLEDAEAAACFHRFPEYGSFTATI
jgi:hypothetical protein